MKKIKVSWSILSAWSSGKRDEAMNMIAGIPIKKTPAMIRGNRLHKAVSRNCLKLIPEISDEAIFEDIVPEQSKWVNYFRVPITEWLELSLVIDVLDRKSKLIVDWKASKLRSFEQNKMQIYIYALAMTLADDPLKVEYGAYATIDEGQAFDVYCKEYTMFKINQEKLDLAMNYIETIGGEIFDFLHQK